MKPGDRVRLKQPFQPEAKLLRRYTCADVVGLIPPDRACVDMPGEVIVTLYDLELDQPYLDEKGIQPFYSFRTDEVELIQAD